MTTRSAARASRFRLTADLPATLPAPVSGAPTHSAAHATAPSEPTHCLEPAVLIERLKQWAALAGDAFSPRTIEALDGDGRLFRAWCLERSLAWLPADPATVVAFMEDVGATRRPATISRYLANISTLHKAAGAPSPTEHPDVKLARKAHARKKGTDQRQAAPLGEREIHVIVRSIEKAAKRAGGASLIELRDRALVLVMSDTLCRASEVGRLRWADIEPATDGSGTLVVRFTKGNYSNGRATYLSPQTMQALEAWRKGLVAWLELQRSNAVQAGNGDRLARLPLPGEGEFIFWNLSTTPRNRLSRQAVWAIIKAQGNRALGTDAYSAHSTRVGTACDIVRSGAGLLEAVVAGGWKTTTQVLRYTRRHSATRGAVARLRSRKVKDIQLLAR